MLAAAEEKAKFNTKDNGMRMVVDSWATDHYVDDQLVKGLRDKIRTCNVYKNTRTVTAAGKHKLRAIASGQ